LEPGLPGPGPEYLESFVVQSKAVLSAELRPSLKKLDHALSGHLKSQPIILDFDGTILLRNSTEAYLDTAWPRPVAAILLALLDLLKPWRLFPGAKRAFIYCDWIRVITVTLILPWTAVLWHRQAARVARTYANTPLLDRLTAWPPESISVATFGFRFIVAPLLASIAPKMKLAVAGSLLGGFALRRSGKAPALLTAIGAGIMSKSLVITDSMDDADLASVSAGMVVLNCPAGTHRRAFQECYIPFQYLHAAKRPGENHLLRQILYQDLLVLLISYAVHSPSPFLASAALLLFQVSYWIIYEIGYWENDIIGFRFEDRPVIRAGFFRFKDRFNPKSAWGLALVFGLGGALLLNLAGAAHVADAGRSPSLTLILIWGIWTGYLFAVRSIYWIYNRFDPVSRVYVYPALQITKNLGFVVLLPISLIGAALCATLVLTRWILYILYRYGGNRWDAPGAVFQLSIFNFLLVVMAIANAGTTTFLQPEFWFVEASVILHARNQLSSLFRSASWLPARRRNDRDAEEPAVL